MTDRMVKGFNLEQTASFIDSHYSHDDRERIHAHLPAALKERLARVKSGSWYPLEDQVALQRAMAAVAPDPETAHRNAVALGRHLSNAATGTFMRLLLKVLTPKVFLKKVPDIWPRMFNFGTFESDPSAFEECGATMLMRDVGGFDHVDAVSTGWIEAVFVAMGHEDAQVASAPMQGEDAGTAYRFDIRWS